MSKCVVCQKEFYGRWLKHHFTNFHKLTSLQYYRIKFGNENKNCLHCGFKLKPTKRGHGLFCDKSCLGKHYGHANGTKGAKSLLQKYPKIADHLIAYIKENPDHQRKAGIKGGHQTKKLYPNLAMDMVRNSKNNFGFQRGKRLLYKNIRMRSSWEVEFAKLCDQNNVKWEYEPKTFGLSDGRQYLPDFYLPKENLWIEIKPLEFQTEKILLLGKILKINYKVLDKKQFKAFFQMRHLPSTTFINCLAPLG